MKQVVLTLLCFNVLASNRNFRNLLVGSSTTSSNVIEMSEQIIEEAKSEEDDQGEQGDVFAFDGKGDEEVKL